MLFDHGPIVKVVPELVPVYDMLRESHAYMDNDWEHARYVPLMIRFNPRITPVGNHKHGGKKAVVMVFN